MHVRTRAVRHDRWGSGSRLSRTGSQGTLGSDTRLVLEAVQVRVHLEVQVVGMFNSLANNYFVVISDVYLR